MRSPNKRAYDNAYYELERRFLQLVDDVQVWNSLRGVRFSREFYDFYRKEICPYWKRFGVKPKLSRVKQTYSLSGRLDVRYIPDDIHNLYIVPHFDRNMYVRPMADKNLHGLLLPGVKRPETVFKHLDGYDTDDDFTPISRTEALDRCGTPGKYILKPTVDTGMGQDIAFFRGEDGPEAIGRLLSSFDAVEYIVQKVVRQHPSLARFNESSMNTTRIVTLFFRGEPHILSSILRVGAPGNEVDNVSQGGYQCTIRPDGTLERYAYTFQHKKHEFVEETADGVRFEGAVIPSWDALRDTALRLCAHMPHLKYIGWDLGVDEAGDVVLVELNSQIGQNQATCGPTFGDMTDEVLSEVFADRMKRRAH